MLVLAIDTATSDLVTGLVDTGTGARTDRVVPDCRGHNETLMPTVTSLVDDTGHRLSDLDAVVVGHGPGPFTGLRVGMATAAALGQALRIPVHGVGTLDAIAAGHAAEHGVQDLLVVTDARRREVYWATYRAGARTAGPDVSQPGELALPHAVQSVVAPEGFSDKLPETVRGAAPRPMTPRAAGLVACADLAAEPAPLSPAYLRRPDAVPPPPAPRSAALPEVRE